MPILDLIQTAGATFFSQQVTEAKRFHLGSANGVVGGGFERVESHYAVQRQHFPYVALEFVAGGAGEVLLDRQIHRLTPGTLFTYGPGVSHRISTAPQTPLVKYFVDVRGPRVLGLLKRSTIGVGTVWQTSQPATIMRIFDELVRSGSSAGAQRQRICDCLLEVLVLHAAESAVPAGAIDDASFATYQRCLRMIDERAVRLRSLEDLAEACALDAAYICRLFKRYDHDSPYQRLLQARMNHAAAMLRSGEVLVKQVAGELGYGDPFHFSRAFKRVVGLSPQQFRRAR